MQEEYWVGVNGDSQGWGEVEGLSSRWLGVSRVLCGGGGYKIIQGWARQ